jgi:hypothetical protein
MSAGTRQRMAVSLVIVIAVGGCGSRTGLPLECLPSLPTKESCSSSAQSDVGATTDAAASTTADAVTDTGGIESCSEGALALVCLDELLVGRRETGADQML